MLLLLPLVVPYALSLPADKQLPPIRAITFDANALAPPALAALTKQHAAAELMPLTEALPREDLLPSLPPCGEFEWVHVATAFKELSAAKNNGAVTVWLNEQAVRDVDEVNTGFLGMAIIGDFADALCASEGEIAARVLEAQATAIEKAAEEEQRALRDLAAELSDEARARPVAWDAKVAEDEDPFGGIFGKMAPQEDAQIPSWAQMQDEKKPMKSAAPDGSSSRSGGGGGTKFCIECGTQLPPSAKFCSSCGAQQ